MARKLDDPDRQARFLEHIRGGKGIYEACHMIDITPKTYRDYIKHYPKFEDEIHAALDAAAEPVLDILRELALEGDVTAAKEYLRHTAGVPRADKLKAAQSAPTTTNNLFVVDPKQISNVQAMAAMLEQRKAELGQGEIHDAEIIEDSESDG